MIEDTFQDGSRIPDTMELYRVLFTVVQQFTSATILIDGVDELVEDDINLVFSHLKALLKDCGFAHIKLFISGREDIASLFQVPGSWNAKVRITADTIAGDIDNYVKYAVRELVRIGELKFGDPLLEDEVVLALANGAKGMYVFQIF
jgi:hypothetical protein